MDSATAKEVAVMATFGAGAVTAAGQIAKSGGFPTLTVVVATFGLATITAGLAEVAPGVAASLALTILATAVFAVSDAPISALSNLSAPRPVNP